jgi:transcriptional regulator with XRE-family HTH domain
MTVPLSPGSPRRVAAALFGVELRKAMKARGVGKGPLMAATDVSQSTLGLYLRGDNLPTPRTADLLAQALRWPRLATIATEARSGQCASCGTAFVNAGGGPKRFCSSRCQQDALRGRLAARERAHEGLTLLRAEMLRSGPLRRQAVGKALTLLDERPDIVAERRLGEHMEAVAAFCRSCSPDGCRTPTCEMRSVSPMPLVDDEPVVEAVKRPPGRWGQPGESERFAAEMRRRWQDPERAARQARGLRDFNARKAADPALRAEWIESVSRGRRRSA